jgi:hypothetical protein
MEKEFIPYKQALELKELGFDEDCVASYNHTKYNIGGLNFGGVNGYSYITSNIIEKFNNTKWFTIIKAPLYQQAFRWFREKYNINVSITSKTLSDGKTVYISHGRTIPDTISKGLIVDIFPYRTDEIYEEAELRCLKELIKIMKNEK